MNEFYIGIISKVVGGERVSFSTHIELPEDITDDDKQAIGESYSITREEAEENPLFEYWFAQIEKKGYWSQWMQDWTGATIYRLYRGQETINV